jgi:hypothetical protein
MRLVTVTPAGRRPYLEILVQYLLRNRDAIAEHQWWLNTRVPEDMAYIYRLADQYPDFFRVIAKPVRPKSRIGYAIWQYMSDCTESDTVYVRLDDDVCYVSEGAIQKLYERRLADPQPFLILGNIVNNAVCTHFHQQAGLIPRNLGLVGDDCMDPRGWSDGAFARKLHRRFLKELTVGNEQLWKQAPIRHSGIDRFSINAICWRGEDFRLIDELHQGEVDEEPFLTADVPRRLGRPNAVCQEALFGHYAFCQQRDFLEATSPDILARYRRLASAAIPAEAYDLPSLERTALHLRRAWGVSAWTAHLGLAKVRSLIRQRQERRAA